MPSTSVVNVHRLGSIDFVDGAGTPATLFKFQALSARPVQLGIEPLILHGAGEPEPSYVAVMNQEPMIPFTTTDVATGLAQLGQGGVAIDPAAGAGVLKTVSLYFNKYTNLGSLASGSSHFKTTINKGKVIPDTLDFSHGQAATLSGAIHPIWDGTNNPLVYASSQALPFTAKVAELFTAGPVALQGSDVDGVLGGSLNFGNTVFKLGAGGKEWPTYISNIGPMPSLTIRTTEVALLSTYGISGAKASAIGTFYLTKVDNMGVRVTDVTAEHIKITFTSAEAMIWCEEASGDTSEVTINIQPIKDTAASLTISTASAIT